MSKFQTMLESWFIPNCKLDFLTSHTHIFPDNPKYQKKLLKFICFQFQSEFFPQLHASILPWKTQLYYVFTCKGQSVLKISLLEIGKQLLIVQNLYSYSWYWIFLMFRLRFLTVKRFRFSLKLSVKVVTLVKDVSIGKSSLLSLVSNFWLSKTVKIIEDL